MNKIASINDQDCAASIDRNVELLNASCFCTTLNRTKLHDALQADVVNQDVLASHPQLFSNTSVFMAACHAEQMQRIVSAVIRVVKLPRYLELVLAQAPSIAAVHTDAEGVFMGYDFHMSEQGPKIIEINTNAGGAFLNATLLSAQTECCRAAEMPLPSENDSKTKEFMGMFLQEWALERGDRPLKTIAILDENPLQQYLYPEFRMAQRLFEDQDLTAVIADPKELEFINGELRYNNLVIDMVYNRLTDFTLENIENIAVRSAYQANAIVLTPNPHHHAIYANKRNLIILSDEKLLAQLGASSADIAILQTGIPTTRIVTSEAADELWHQRKQLFFKPAAGFGGRAAYRGDKLTKRVWGEILQGDYVAQDIVIPSERGILVDGHETSLKVDIRAYVYAGEIQLLAARLYQGQTTNFRTQGGGFASVFVG